jgi:hypothetical protein
MGMFPGISLQIRPCVHVSSPQEALALIHRFRFPPVVSICNTRGVSRRLAHGRGAARRRNRGG